MAGRDVEHLRDGIVMDMTSEAALWLSRGRRNPDRKRDARVASYACALRFC